MDQSVCSVCGIKGDHKLQCPERDNPQMQVDVRQTEDGWEAIGPPYPVGTEPPSRGQS